MRHGTSFRIVERINFDAWKLEGPSLLNLNVDVRSEVNQEITTVPYILFKSTTSALLVIGYRVRRWVHWF